jgi:hypothetical protein
MNIDVQPPLIIQVVFNYLGKYILKLEKASVLYIKLQNQILPYLNNKVLLLSFVLQMLNKLIKKQD